MSSSKRVIEEMLALVAARTPWAVLGYSPELSREWNKNFAGFLAGVAERKIEFERRAKRESTPD